MSSEYFSAINGLEVEPDGIEGREAQHVGEIAFREAHDARQAQTQVIETQETSGPKHTLIESDLRSIGAHFESPASSSDPQHLFVSSGASTYNYGTAATHRTHQRTAANLSSENERGPQTNERLGHDDDSALRRQQFLQRSHSSPFQDPTTGDSTSPYLWQPWSSPSSWLRIGLYAPPWSQHGWYTGLGIFRPAELAVAMSPTRELSISSSSCYHSERSQFLCDMHLSQEPSSDWQSIRDQLSDAWRWDVEYSTHYATGGARRSGCWTYTPVHFEEPKDVPLTIASIPVVIPVEYRWSPMSGSMPPPDPRPEAPIDCRAPITLELMKDIFLTFEGSIGFNLLINGLLQVIVPAVFDTAWASSHLPQRYGGLKVCYIERTLEPTMLPRTTDTSGVGLSLSLLDTPRGRIAPPSFDHSPARSPAKKTTLKFNAFIEARPLSTHRRGEHAGRMGLKVARKGSPFVVMSTHIITGAILAKSRWEAIFSLWSNARFARLEDDWNDRIEVWAGDQKVSIHLTFTNSNVTHRGLFRVDNPLVWNSREDV